MLTMEKLKSWGADVDDGMQRCLNNEVMYLRLVNKFLQAASFERLPEALSAHDLEAAFQAAHDLKGSAANLGLAPILGPVSRMTEQLRARREMDYGPDLEKLLRERDALKSLAE